ncbi:Ryanodine receptor 2 [Tupaia chinensis]|uniref:Ryanodine receptor 2 n=1 Tax=Tupaia chinensis TaxID=246437 RepID=L9KYT3_TUPCH|nr:Ryanodine receptor 2 [Tupaia chinensis]
MQALLAPVSGLSGLEQQQSPSETVGPTAPLAAPDPSHQVRRDKALPRLCDSAAASVLLGGGVSRSASNIPLRQTHPKDTSENEGRARLPGAPPHRVLWAVSWDKVLQDDEFTCDLFRFLQLLCEGHNSGLWVQLSGTVGEHGPWVPGREPGMVLSVSGCEPGVELWVQGREPGVELWVQGHFQNYLRTQTGNNTTVNIIISTVDYLLRVQESISDFYWYYSGKDVIDEQGQRNFSKAIQVAKQVFNTLTEYIQGPCTGNQQSLAHSRLWDAVVGFLHVFAHMQMKLSQRSFSKCRFHGSERPVSHQSTDPAFPGWIRAAEALGVPSLGCGEPVFSSSRTDSSQIELLKELMDLQKDMVVTLLSMLEGNVVNGTIGKQMVDMLVESSHNVEMILKFFDMFLKLKDLTSSDTFKECDPDGKGVISKRDFHRAMEGHKHYTPSETEFLLSCAETDENETLDYEEFVKRFHEPAKDIGFNVAVLLTNLSEHMPHDPRLHTFLALAESALHYFQPFLGRIEIMGSAKRIERVYFEISESSRTQWEKPQVKESKRQFIFDVVNEGGEKEKMELFVNFCEDTIFEMQLAAQISESDLNERSASKEDSERDRPEEQGPRPGFFSVLMLRSALLALRYNLLVLLRLLSLKSLKKQVKRAKRMTVRDLLAALLASCWRLLLGLLRFAASVARGFFRIVCSLLLGGSLVEGAKKIKVAELLASMPDPTQDEEQKAKEEEKQEKEEPRAEPEKAEGGDGEKEDKANVKGRPRPRQLHTHRHGESEVPESAFWKKITAYQQKLLNYFARNFYNMRMLALFVAFAINFILLFYKVSTSSVAEGKEPPAQSPSESAPVPSVDGDSRSVIAVHYVLEESSGYMEPTLRILAVLHTVIAFFCIIGYYCLKVPLVIFKREKEVARKLEFGGLYVTEQPSEDDIKGQWDRLAINTQ